MNDAKYIGMDVHQATISVAVRDLRGNLVMEAILETKAETILQFIGGLRGSLYQYLVNSIAAGRGSPTIMAGIVEREARIRAIADKLVEPGPESLQERLADLRDFAVSRLTRLRDLLGNPAAIPEARALLAEQVGKITMERVTEDGKPVFKAAGVIDFFGEEALAQLSGAGGQNRTGYARLFRAALYQ
jgi:hypothetical protein